MTPTFRTILTFGILITPLLSTPAQDAGTPIEKTVRHKGLKVQIIGTDDEADWLSLSEMIKNQLSLSGDVAPTEPLADDLSFFTRQHLVSNGRPDATVRWDLKPPGIVLTVDPGKRVIVGEITWKGDTTLPTEELEPLLLRPTNERNTLLKGDGEWVEDELQRGAGLVERRLRADGHLLAKATIVPNETLAEDGSRDLRVDVEPGPVFEFGDVSLSGEPPGLESQLRLQTSDDRGRPFNEARVQQLADKLKSICVENGYLQTEVSSDYRLGTQGGTVDVEIVITSGPRARISNVVIHPGFTNGATRVLNADFRDAVGTIYDADALDLMFRRALTTDMFARLDYEAIPIGTSEDGYSLTELRLTGEQTKPQTLGFEVGFDTFLGAQLGMTYRDTNFHDTGNTLASELSWSVAGPLGFLKLTDPALFNSHYAATTQLSVEQFSLFDYTRYGSGLNFELVRRVSDPFSFSLFVGASANTVDTKTLTAAELGPSSYTLLSIGGSMTYDMRDSAVLPTKGYFLSGRIENTLDAFGSGLTFSRTDLRAAWYHPISKKWRFAAGMDLQTIMGASVTDLPIDSRVFNGGPNSVRSFAQRELGPFATGGQTPLGGTSAFFATAEFSYELMTNLEFAIFTDFGSLGQSQNSAPIAIDSDFRQAIGAGLRYHLPFGPLRIDYGRNPSPRAGETSGMLHITVGFSF